MSLRSYRNRYVIVYIITFILFIPIYYRLLYLQVLNRDSLQQLASKQHKVIIEIPPRRGYFFDRNENEIATSLKVPSIYAVPRLMQEKDKRAKDLARILNQDINLMKERLARDKTFVWIKRKVTEQEAKEIHDLHDPNINIIYEHKRFYPHKSLFSHLLGFCDIDNKGLEGLELMLNDYLKGRMGYQYTKRDARGRKLIGLDDEYIPPVEGYNVILTIDKYIQYIVEQELQEAYTKWNAKGASAIVMNCNTGEILAMANRPTYDLNNFNKTKEEVRRNRSITDCFEPGSVFKIVTASAALQEKTVDLNSEIFCENGEYQFTPRRILHDVHGYGTLDFANVIIKSSNIGTVKIAQELGEDLLFHYIKEFGFGSISNVDLPGEVGGILRHKDTWSKIAISSIPIGQGVAATALQMVTAISVIANGGHVVTPYVVNEIRDEHGVSVKSKHPIIRRTIIDESVAHTMRDILVRVVEEGTGKNAHIDGTLVAGKTGTAQKILPNGGGYSHTDFVGSFIGFVPADDPAISIIVVIDEPRPRYYGGTVAAPVFKNIAEKTLNYLKVAQS